MNYNIFGFIFSLIGGLMTGLFFSKIINYEIGHIIGFITTICLYLYMTYKFKLYKNNKVLIENIKFTRG